ncbi:MAG TPA: hypothetical protein VD772_00610 [Anseongella sp.]|nr:hypothetical protein [Anseongella sp.]
MKKHSPRTEHYYIPVALLLLNSCLIHVLFALSAGNAFSGLYKAALGAGLAALVLGIIVKRPIGILLSGLFYLLILSGLLNPLLCC